MFAVTLPCALQAAKEELTEAGWGGVLLRSTKPNQGFQPCCDPAMCASAGQGEADGGGLGRPAAGRH